MARKQAKKISAAQQRTGYAILVLLGLISVWLLVQQARFNPALLESLQVTSMVGQLAAGAGQAATAAFIPEVPGFQPLGPPQSHGPENLSDKIDGKAELYLAAGFQEMSCRSFRLESPAGAYLEVFIYDMGTPTNAYAVFSSQRRPGALSLALTANAYATPNALFFTQGSFYVEMVVDRAVEDLPGALAAFTTALLARMPPAAATATLADLFPAEGLAADSVRLNASDAFGLQGFDAVYTGEYILKDGRATAFLAERPSPTEAQAEAQRYRDFLVSFGYRERESPEVLPDGTVLALDTQFDVIMVLDNRVLGVHDVPSWEAALELVARLRQAISGKP